MVGVSDLVDGGAGGRASILVLACTGAEVTADIIDGADGGKGEIRTLEGALHPLPA